MAQPEVLKGTATDAQDAPEHGLMGGSLRSIRVVGTGAGSDFAPRLSGKKAISSHNPEACRRNHCMANVQKQEEP
jgi:hypothetical protein